MHTARGIIVPVQVEAVKIYVAASEDAQEKRKTRWNSEIHQNWWFSEFQIPPPPSRVPGLNID